MRLPILSFCLSAVLATAAAAQAPQQLPGTCGVKAVMLEALLGEWGESPAAVGMAGKNVPVIFTLNRTTGTWSLLASFPEKGTVCFVAAGRGWQAVEQRAPEQGI